MFTKPARLRPLRRPTTAAIAAALTAIALAQTATPAAAADRFWTCPPNYFTNPVCWSNPGPLQASDNLLIRPNGPIPVEVNFPGAAGVNTTQMVRTLTLNGAANSAKPTLYVSSGSLSLTTLTVGVDYGAAVRQTGGSVGIVGTQINQFSSYSLSGGSLSASANVSNMGVLDVSGTGRLLGRELVNSGSLSLTGANANIETETTQNYGVIRLTDATWSSPSGVVYNAAGAAIYGSNSSTPALVENKGNLVANSGTLALANYGPALANSGGIAVLNFAELSVPRGLVNAARGVIALNGVDAGSGPQAYLSNANTGATLINNGALGGAGFVLMPVEHQGDLRTNVGKTLTFSQSFSSAAGSTMASDGVLSFAGPASFHNGALISGAGASLFNGTLNLGDAGAAGRLRVDGDVSLRGMYFADILGTVAGAGYDQLAVGGKLTLAPGSVLRLGSGSFVAQAGQSFNLLDWDTLQGTFAQVDTSALQLAAGTALDLSRLYIDGTLAVVAVPEPATWALTIAGIVGLLARRRMGHQAWGQA